MSQDDEEIPQRELEARQLQKKREEARINSSDFITMREKETNEIKEFFKKNGYTMVNLNKLQVGNKYYIIRQYSRDNDEHMEVVEKYFNKNGELCDKEKILSTGTYGCIGVPTEIWEFNRSFSKPMRQIWTQPVQSNPITRYGGKKTKSKTKNKKRSMRTSKTKRRFKKHKKTRRR